MRRIIKKNFLPILVLFVLSFHKTIGQTDAPILQVIEKLSKEREKLLFQSPCLLEFSNIIAKIEKDKVRKELQVHICDFLCHMVFNSKNPLDSILLQAQNFYPESKVLKQLNEDQLICLAQNYQLLKLIKFGILSKTYPFKLQPSDFISELKFYNIQKGECIAEIGSGNGIFSFLMYLLDNNLHIYINEIIEDYLLNTALLFDPEFKSTNTFNFILGNETDIHIDTTLDKVIIRNSYHHFNFKDDMLTSIKSKLKDNGFLFIKEYKDTSKNKREKCNSLLSERSIIETVTNNGFVLIEKKKMANSSNIYKFRKRLNK